MGTRGAYGFRVDGADKVTYNHFGSYPAGLGADMLDYVRRRTPDQLAETARRLVLVDERQAVPADLVERYHGWADLDVSEQRIDSWYCLLRKVQRNPEAWDRGVDHMIDGHDFLADSLFCEFAYIINIDDGVLEFYKGFNKDQKAAGRYAALRRRRRRQGYFGVALLDTVKLSRFKAPRRAQILKAWNRDDEEEAEGVR